MKTLKIIIESTGDSFWGTWESGEDIVVSRGEHLQELKENLLEAFGLYFEGTNQDVPGVDDLGFEFQVDG